MNKVMMALGLVLVIGWPILAQDAEPPAASDAPPAAAAADAQPAGEAAEKSEGKADDAAATDEKAGDADKEDAAAENGKEGKGDAKDGKDAKGKGKSKPKEYPKNLDIIFLTNGNYIAGEVIKRTPKSFIVEVSPGVDIEINRKQILIDKVRYDDNPGRMKVGEDAENADGKQDLVPGKKISAELHEKLNKDIANPPFEFNNMGFGAILQDLAKRAGVTIELDASIKPIPPEQRKWPLEPMPQATLFAILEEKFTKQFPNLAVVYQNDKIVIATKEAAQALQGGAPAAAAATAAPAASPEAPAAPAAPAATEPPAPPAALPAPAPAPAPAPVTQ